jgi:RNA polymerase sigma-70 factor (ECF subfamily)
MVAPHTSPVRARRPSAERAARAALARDEARHDAGLVRRFNGGDESAFVEIVTRYRGRLRQVALGLIRNHADAEEIAQDTFVRAHRALALFRGESSLSAWLHCIALNLARNRYWYFFRRRRHASLPLDAACGPDGAATFADLIASPAPDPRHLVATREFAGLAAAGLARLNPTQREILTLRNRDQRSYLGIARTLGVKVGTVKSRIARARGQLRVLLTEACPEFPPDAAPADWFEPVRAAGRLEIAAA